MFTFWIFLQSDWDYAKVLLLTRYAMLSVFTFFLSVITVFQLSTQMARVSGVDVMPYCFILLFFSFYIFVCYLLYFYLIYRFFTSCNALFGGLCCEYWETSAWKDVLAFVESSVNVMNIVYPPVKPCCLLFIR